MKVNPLIVFLAMLVLVSTGLSCSLVSSFVNPTPTATLPPPSATASNTALPPTPSATATDAATPAVTNTSGTGQPIETSTQAAPAGAVSLPVTFNIVLSAPATSCGEGITSEFTITLTNSTITMYQIEYQLTSSGPYNPSSGAFTSTVSGLPGTETFTGRVTFTPSASGTTIAMNGEFTYTGDPDWTCTIPDVFSGQTVFNP